MQIENAKIFKDKKLNNLGDFLKDKIKSRKDPFYTVSIIFPNNKVIEWFRSYWLKTEKDVLMNVKFYSLEEGLYDLLELPNKFTLIKRPELRTLIIKELTKLNKTELDDKIGNYIYNVDGFLDSIKLYDLANSLSKLFIEYELDAIIPTGCQKIIYDNVLSELYQENKGTFSYIYEKNKVFKKVEEVIFFGFSDLAKLYCNVISELGYHTDVLFYQIDNELDLSMKPILMSAPSKTREIEMIHSEICKLVLNKDVKYSDILVICPDVSRYELEIMKVFNQDNETFPSIPFSINARKQQTTFAEQAIKKLFEIASKGFYTRLDFSQLINNKMIQESRKITEDDVNNWTKSIIEMNVYRNGKKIDDWQYAKKRVVLSKVSNMNAVDDNIVELSSGNYIPYSNIDFDDNSICRFASLIDDLDKWISEFKKDSVVKKEKLETLIIELEKWFSIKDQYGHESNKIFRKYIQEVKTWIYKEIFSNKIPLNTLFYTLFDLSLESKGSQSNMFTRGVTFVDYEENITLSSKYIFMIGLSSNEFPNKNTLSELDERKTLKNVNDIKSFYCQSNNATNTLYLSHVNYDLKGDEEFFPSTFIIKLYNELGIKLVDEETDEILYDKKIGIDETRPWKELFTKKEFKEKDYYYGLFNTVEVDTDEVFSIKKDVVKKVTVSQMKNFLTEPLKYKAEHLFGYEDETSDLIKDEYEPIILNNLDNAILVKSVIVYMLKHSDCELVNSSNEVDLDIAKDIFARFIIEHKIPDLSSEIEDNNIISVVLEAKGVVDKIMEITKCDYNVLKLDDIALKINEEEVIFTYNGELCLSVDGNNRKYIELASGDKKNKFALLTMYVCSLLDISLIDTDDEYIVELYKGPSKETYKVTPSIALETLIDIYNEMNNYEANIFFPIKFVEMNKTYKDLLKDATDSSGSWGFFKGRKIFSPLKNLGFNMYNYDIKSNEMKKMLKRLVIYLNKEEK